MELIRIENCKKTYGKGTGVVNALSGVDISIKEGEMVAIMGKSGSGKSTLLNIIGGMLSMDEGEYYFEGKKQNLKNKKNLVLFRRDIIGFVVQYFALIDDMTVFENVAMPLKYQKKSRREIKKKVMKILENLNLTEKKSAYPDELSGGQQQRVGIARALVKEPKLILADEPTGALDARTGEEVMKLFHEMNEEGKTVIIVTHDEKVASECGRVIRMVDGKIAQ
ncbi:MAG: ABC transporter ATP-binding protein [Lachnospiraceae bacterium]|nr:ABC transporter ATP-binding protein [Lachnospiraceae bacterium]